MPFPTTPRQAVQAAIVSALAPIAPQWKADTIAVFVKEAEGEYETAITRLTAGDEAWFKRKPFFRFVDRTEKHRKEFEYDYKTKPFAQWQDAAKRGEIVCDRKRATQCGENEFDAVYMAFVTRSTDKISECFSKTARLEVTGQLHYRPHGMIEGAVRAVDLASLDLASGNADELQVAVSVKTNYRYGENSANGRLTVYAQYPMLVELVIVGGVKHVGVRSLESAAVLISGRNPIEEKRQAKEQLKQKKAARNKEVWALEKQKQAYDEIASHYRFYEAFTSGDPKVEAERRAEKCAKYGITDPGSKKAANEKIKELREQIKALKGSPL